MVLTNGALSLDVRNCPRCGQIFRKTLSVICSKCEKREEDQYQSLRSYIEDNPLCNLQELTDATQVPEKQILIFVRDGRLEISEGMRGIIKCSKCAEPITRGNFCNKCSSGIITESKDYYSNKQQLKKQELTPRRG